MTENITPTVAGESIDIDPNDQRLIRDALDERVVRQLESHLGLGALSDGEKDVSINTDRLIRLVQSIARDEARHARHPRPRTATAENAADAEREGWQAEKRYDQRRYHFIRGTFSLCQKLGFYFGELVEGGLKPSDNAEDCAQCVRHVQKELDKKEAAE